MNAFSIKRKLSSYNLVKYEILVDLTCYSKLTLNIPTNRNLNSTKCIVSIQTRIFS